MSHAKPLKILAGAWLTGLVLWTTKGFASSEFPQIVADTLTMPCVPTCLLCHNNLQGGPGTIRDDVNGGSFGIMAIANGIQKMNTASVAPALMSIETAMPDTDGDGTNDIAELRAGADPNESGPGNVCGGDPTYGCGAHIARGRAVDSAALTAALGAAIVLVLARRRR